jgi:hypothetical protein
MTRAEARERNCDCIWCRLARLFAQLKDAGIHNQRELDERLRQIREENANA